MAMNAELQIETIAKEGVTLLKNSFCTQPFKLADVTENRRGKVLQLVLMSSSPGILDGDTYQLKICLREGSALHLQTQSYQRLFTMKKSASQNMEVSLEKNASFRFLPHPVVPHLDADFTAVNKIFLTSGCKLIWGEVFTCGRKLNAEIFHFRKYRCTTEIFLSGRLIIMENVLMMPTKINMKQLGQMEGYTHQATLIFLDETAVIKELMEVIYKRLIKIPDIDVGITVTTVNGFVVRLLGFKAEQLFDCLKTIADELECAYT